MKNLIFLLGIMHSLSGWTCLNIYYGVDQYGNIHEYGEKYLLTFKQNFNSKRIQKKLEKLEPQIKDKQDYQLLSDYAVFLLKIGKTEEALEILIALSQAHPTEYQIIANLGTAYELNGQVDSALCYIKKGIELNPESHGGSEWVHVRILETKQKLQTDSLYLHQYTVLKLTEKEKKKPETREQLLIQLQERFPFCPTPNPIMSSLLLDLGECFAATHSIEHAKAIFSVGYKVYGDTLAKAQSKEMIKLREKYTEKRLERRQIIEGEYFGNSKVIGLRYQDLLKKYPNYDMKWEKINTNIDTLLAYVNLQKVVFPEQMTDIQKDSVVQEVEFDGPICDLPVEELELNEAFFSKKIVYVFGAVLVLILAIFIYRKSKE